MDRYEGHDLMFPPFYCHFPGGKLWPLSNDGLWDVRMVHSRDGVRRTIIAGAWVAFFQECRQQPCEQEHFSYIAGDRAPILSRGSWGGPPTRTNYEAPPNSDWDSSEISILPGMIVRGDKIRMMKFGTEVRHGQEHLVGSDGRPIPSGGLVAIEWRLDGFGSMSTTALGGNGEGEFTTHPFTFTGSELQLNCDVRGGGFLRVEIQNAAGTAHHGLAANDSLPIVGSFVNRTA
eukprot:COSAG04_NODE_3497_length_2770_cov_4.736054_4_plen_231_part_01